MSSPQKKKTDENNMIKLVTKINHVLGKNIICSIRWYNRMFHN